MTITLRNTKGSALTHAELDGNFTDLNSNKAAASHTHSSGSISDFIEAAQDAAAALLTAGVHTGLTATYDDANARVNLAVSAGGAALVVQEGDSTIVSAAATLDLVAADFDVTETPSGEANVAIAAAIARILAPVTLSANTSLTAAAHANRTIYVDTAGVVLTINNDATGGWTSDDALDIQAVGAATFTLVQGTATLTTGSGMSAASATAAGKRVQAQRTAADAWNTLSLATPSGGGGSVTVIDIPVGSVVGASQTEAALGSVSIPTFLAGKKMRVEAWLNVQTSNGATIEVLYGGTVMFSNADNLNSFGSSGGAMLAFDMWATQNNEQRGNPYGLINNVSPLALTGAVDGTTAQTLLIRITTGAGTTAVQLMFGKVTQL
jgi:hypothetical protein